MPHRSHQNLGTDHIMFPWGFGGHHWSIRPHWTPLCFFCPQPCCKQLGSAASRPAASSLPATLHPLRSGQWERRRRLLGVCPPPQQAAWPRPARLPGSAAVCSTLHNSLTSFLCFCASLWRLMFVPHRKFWPVSIPVSLPAPGEKQQVLMFDYV